MKPYLFALLSAVGLLLGIVCLILALVLRDPSWLPCSALGFTVAVINVGAIP